MSDDESQRSNSPLPLPKRRRSPSPNKRRKRPKQSRKPVLIILQAPHQEKRWREVFMTRNFQVYDHIYPFRLAARTILRQDPRRNQRPSLFSKQNTEPLARELSYATSHLMGAYFAFDYFKDWFQGLAEHDRNRIVVCGLEQDPSIELFKRMYGAVVVSENGANGSCMVQHEAGLHQLIDELSA